MIRYIFTTLAVILAAASVLAQAPASPMSGAAQAGLWNTTIVSVDVEGLVSADTFLVLNASGLASGEVLSPAMVQDAIKGIYALGLFSDVQIEGFPEKIGTRVSIKVIEYPKLRKLKITGNKRFKTKTIKENLSLFEGRLVSPEAIKNNIEKIKALYAEKGYLLVRVDITKTAVEEEPGKVDLQFDIADGTKVQIASITFSGNRHFTAGKLRGQIKAKQKSFFRSGNFDRDKYLEDKDKIINFYKDNGYIDAVILGDSISYSSDKTKMFINISLREGDRYYFGNLTWQGNKLFNDGQFAKNVAFRPGKIYDQKKYDETIGKFHEIYQDEGYWYAQIEEKTTPRGDTLDFHLNITENNPVHIRLINIEGNSKTKEKVIRRELTILPETIFKRSILGRSLRELMILNFFSNVEPGWDILPNGDIDLKLKVTEKETGQFSVGAGYSQNDQFVATIGLGVPNLLGSGQTATLDMELGGRLTTFSFSYLEPWLLDTPTSLSGGFYVQSRQWYDWFLERRTGGNLQVGRRLRWPDNYFRLYASYSLERVRYSDIKSDYINKVSSRPLTTSSAGLTLMRDSRDLPMFPTKGSTISWKGQLAGTFLGGDWNYYKQEFLAEYYKKLFWKVVLMGRARYGVMGGIHHGDADIPYTDRFAPGGVDPDGTIRGYDDGRVGPYDYSGAFLRGRLELIYNLELTIPISEQQFYVILFADAGNAYSQMKDVHLFRHYFRSVGPGFRIMIPMVGIMGFDFGYAFDSLYGSKKGQWKTHFQIGRGF